MATHITQRFIRRKQSKRIQGNCGENPPLFCTFSSSEEASYDSESEDSVHHVDKESSIQKKPQPSELHDLVPWKADTVSGPKVDEKELLSTTLNLSDVGTSLRTPRDSGTSPTSQFLERDGVTMYYRPETMKT